MISSAFWFSSDSSQMTPEQPSAGSIPQHKTPARSPIHGARSLLAFRLLSLACLVLFLNACHRKDENAETTSPTPPPKPASEIWKEFSGDKAFDHTAKLVALGPRPAGSDQLVKAREYIIDTLKGFGWQIEPQRFTDDTPNGPISFVNLIARFPVTPGKPASTTTQEVIVASHYDTKLFNTIRFVGASDGGSSTGALIELARVLALDPGIATKVELVFFDGEEAVRQFTETDGIYGSRFYARQLRESGRNKQFKFGILWDMIGKKDLSITLPPDSPSQLAKGIFDASDALNLRSHFTFYDRDLIDDHVPLNESHIPTIDLIDFNYMYWHTADDLMDKLSPESLQIVGSVTLYYIEQRLQK